MVAPIVPFVVGMLSNLAGRKEKYETAQAAKSVADYEFGQQKQLKNMEFGNASKLEFIKRGGTSMFNEFTSSLLPINMGGPNVEAFLKEQTQEFKYDLGIRTKLWGIKATAEGPNATGKAFNWIGQLNNFSDTEWAYVNKNYPSQAGRIKGAIKGRVSLIDKDMRQTDTGMSEGALNYQKLFSDYSPWIKGVIVGNIENEQGKVFDNNNILHVAPKEVPLNIANSWSYTSKGTAYDPVDVKKATDYYSQVGLEVALFTTPLPQKEALNQTDNISDANGRAWLREHPIQSVGFTQFGPIMLNKIYKKNGQLADVRAKDVYDSPFQHPDLLNAANYVTNAAFRFADDKLVPGSQLYKLRQEGYHYNYLDAVYYQIDALAAVAGPHDLPGSFVGVGVDRGYARDLLYNDGSKLLEERFNLTPTIIKGYRELARQGELALDNTRRQKELIDKLDLGGTFLTGAISLYEQAKTAGGDIFSILTGGIESKQFNSEAMTNKITAQTEGLDSQMSALNTQIATATGKEKTDLETRLKNLNAAKGLLDSLKTTFSGMNMNDAYLNADDFKGNTTKQDSIRISKLALLRGGLVFYAAAIFQGEGGKAISDGDRELVTRALAVSPFATRDQALAALDEFDLGMASIIGRADRIGNGNIQQKWAALNYTNVYPMLNDSNNSMNRRSLPNSTDWTSKIAESSVTSNVDNTETSTELTGDQFILSGQVTNMSIYSAATPQTKKSLTFILSKMAVDTNQITKDDQDSLRIFADTNELEY